MSARYILDTDEEAMYRRAPRVIAPSRIGHEYWEGYWAEGDTFSQRQLRALREEGRDPETIDRLEVIAAGDPRCIYIPRHPYFYRRLTCPVVGQRGDRLMVISPNGTRKLVYPDGSLTRPKARRWR